VTGQGIEEQQANAMRATKALEQLGCKVVSTTCSVHYTRAQIQIADAQPLSEWMNEIGQAPKLPYWRSSNWLHGRAVFQDCDVAWLVLKKKEISS